MMNKARILVLTIIVMLIGSVSIFAASDTASHDVTMQVNEVVLLDIDDVTTMTLNTTAPANGGEDVTGSTDTRLLQYTSLVAGATTRTISVSWGALDAAPAGTELKIEATGVAAGCGTAGAQITVSNVAQNIVTAIGSCATGTGASGTEVTYTLNVTDVSALDVAGDSTVTITYTLTDAA